MVNFFDFLLHFFSNWEQKAPCRIKQLQANTQLKLGCHGTCNPSGSIVCGLPAALMLKSFLRKFLGREVKSIGSVLGFNYSVSEVKTEHEPSVVQLENSGRPDRFQLFLASSCFQSAGARIQSAHLHALYIDFCNANGFPAVSAKRLAREIGRLGFARAKSSSMWWIGLGAKSDSIELNKLRRAVDPRAPGTFSIWLVAL